MNRRECEDAISREDVIKAVDHHTFDTDDGLCLDEDISIILEDLPPVKPKQKTGHWIWCVGSHKCSNCEEYTCFSHKKLLRYCPNCGAKMESEEA